MRSAMPFWGTGIVPLTLIQPPSSDGAIVTWLRGHAVLLTVNLCICLMHSPLKELQQISHWLLKTRTAHVLSPPGCLPDGTHLHTCTLNTLHSYWSW